MRTVLLTLAAALVLAAPAASERTVRLVVIASAPDWSPDGSSIAYAQQLPGTVDPRSELVVASTRNSARRTVARDAYVPRWSPDGSEIAYLGRAPESGNVTELRLVPAAGGTPTVVAEGIANFAWSSDGRELLYDHGALSCSAITAVNTNDPSQQRLIVEGARPMPSPDGRRIAFLSSADGTCVGGFGHLSVANVDGSDVHVVLPADVIRAVWSPDGTRLAAEVERDDQTVDIFILNADGSDARLVAHGSHAAWSPDGRRIAYLSLPLRNAPFPHDEPYLQLLDVATGFSGPRLISASAEILGGPVWSPDGKKVALSRALERGGVTEGESAGLNRYVSLYAAPIHRAAQGRMISIASCRLIRPACTLAGGPGGNTLVGTADRDVIWGYGGDDRIDGGAGNDELHGGSGNDVIIGGPGRDVISGGSGGDVVFAGDGQADRVYCGTGYDVVIADRMDTVAPDCERVVRT